jgi:hypothetical protein
LKFFNFEIDLILLNLIDFETNFLPQYWGWDWTLPDSDSTND